MTKAGPSPFQLALAGAAGMGLLMVDDVSPTTSGYFVTRAHAIIGRPATPMSYAGVARRTTRREAYGAGAYGGYRGYGYGAGAVGAAAVGAAAYGAATYGAGNCVQVTDVYGRLVTQCY
jgi:hypothetical protein